MRCPKCGYISFDHLETCGKCSKDLTDVVENFGGGLVRAVAPQFLVMTPSTVDSYDADSFPNTEQGFDEDILDEDLNVLLADDIEDGEAPLISLSDEDVGDDDLDGSVDFDFSFESEDEGEDDKEFVLDEDEESSSFAADEEFTLAMPTALSDISDLAPEKTDDSDDEIDFNFSLEDDLDELPSLSTNDDFDSFDLEDLNLELESILPETEELADKEDFELSLNDIEFSEMGQTGGTPALNPDGSVDMDVDLDFELDLGGLSLHKKEEKV